MAQHHAFRVIKNVLRRRMGCVPRVTEVKDKKQMRAFQRRYDAWLNGTTKEIFRQLARAAHDIHDIEDGGNGRRK